MKEIVKAKVEECGIEDATLSSINLLITCARELSELSV
jgi:hypothetical protein